MKMEKCYLCSGTGQGKDKCCRNCSGKGEIEIYICQNCGKQHSNSHLFDNYDGQCDNCYADIGTGKYTDDFFYIIKRSLKEIKEKVQMLIKEGYIPMGRCVLLNEYWISQAIIRKTLLKYKRK